MIRLPVAGKLPSFPWAIFIYFAEEPLVYVDILICRSGTVSCISNTHIIFSKTFCAPFPAPQPTALCAPSPFGSLFPAGISPCRAARAAISLHGKRTAGIVSIPAFQYGPRWETRTPGILGCAAGLRCPKKPSRFRFCSVFSTAAPKPPRFICRRQRGAVLPKAGTLLCSQDAETSSSRSNK